VPIPQSLALEPSAHVATWKNDTVLVDMLGHQWRRGPSSALRE
jgi:hypothetical protein